MAIHLRSDYFELALCKIQKLIPRLDTHISSRIRILFSYMGLFSAGLFILCGTTHFSCLCTGIFVFCATSLAATAYSCRSLPRLFNILAGTIGFMGTNMFIRRIYQYIKSD